ncbi:hypothetical protein U27_05772 [Candidatus Vecturithrix granuli]|uniref:Antitoxin n=1 Tax=Vecturithrix granuli TaxID=1499967 RepID=A0A081C2J2_VECG1|nr:hypothetical protein U27_05772 [Candidatus Vecturithrix granuli]
MKHPPLNQEEQDWLDSYERDEWVSINNAETRKKYQAIAQSTLHAERQVKISLSERDWTLIQEKAMREGLSYQAFMRSVLHKYITGRLTEHPGT